MNARITCCGGAVHVVIIAYSSFTTFPTEIILPSEMKAGFLFVAFALLLAREPTLHGSVDGVITGHKIV